MNFFKKKTFQYGSAAVILVAVVLALVVILNVILSLFTQKFGWYADISSSKYFRFSEQSLKLLDEIDGENNKLTVYFFSDENILNATDYGKYIMGLVGELDNRYDHVSVEHFDDLNKDFWAVSEIFGEKYIGLFDSMYQNGEFLPGTVILRNDTYVIDENGDYVIGITGEKQVDHRLSIFNVNDMYVEGAAAFLGDFLLTGRILGLCRYQPKAYFLTGHGDIAIEGEKDYGNAEMLRSLFLNLGFETEKLDLKSHDFAKDRHEATTAVIFAPRVDFTEDEIKRLEAFVSDGGNLMVFTDGNYYRLDKLTGFLSRYGITVANAKIQAGQSASLGDNGFMFAADVAWEHLPDLLDKESKMVVSSSRLLRLDASKGAKALLQTPVGFTPIGSDTEMIGNEAVAALSSGEGHGSVFVSGAASLASSLIYTPAYNNRNLLISVIEGFGTEELPLNVDIKTLASDGLDLTKSQATALSLTVSLLPALIAAVLGTVICIRRKRS